MLLDLPDVLLGSVFELLSGQERRSFMHTCKALHNSDACLSKVCAEILLHAKAVNGFTSVQ